MPCKLILWIDGNKAGEIWAVVLSEDGQYLAATSFDGRINVWDNLADGSKIREFETKGSFGMSIDLVPKEPVLSILPLTYSSLRMEDSRPQDTKTAGYTSSITIPADSFILYPVGGLDIMQCGTRLTLY